MQAALIEAIAAVRQELTRLSLQHKSTATIGRTHGQHAIPITMGFKFANYLYEFSVAEHFLERVEVGGEGVTHITVPFLRYLPATVWTAVYTPLAG